MDGGFIDAWPTERRSMLLLTFTCAGFILKQERLSVMKLKPATCFAPMLAAEPVSGGSQVQAAHEAATGLAFGRKDDLEAALT